MPQELEQVRLLIGGRWFVQESPTFEQELFIWTQATEAGLADLAHLQLDPQTQSLPTIAQRMIISAYKSGALFLLMAALLTEDGTEWTEDAARLNAEFFKHVRDQDSKTALQTGLAASVVAFFQSAAASAATFRTSSDETLLSRLPDADNFTLARKPMTPEEAAAAFASGRMPSPSAKSPSTTRSTRGSSSAGRSGKGSSRSSGSSKRT